MAELPLVLLSGSPFDRGRLHGAALADRVAANVALYSGRLRDDAGLTDSEVAERVDFYREVFTRLDGDYVETMAGIAEGSGRSMSEIVMLNARFELLYSAWSHAGTLADADDCTGFGIPRDRSADGRLWIGQNWDWFPDVQGGLLAWRDGDLVTLAYTEAGIAGCKIGLNSAGVGLCVNGLGCDADDWKRGGMPFHLRTSRILGSRRLAEALGHAAVDAPSCSANFLIGSRDQGIVDVESSPVGARRIPAVDDRVLVHANHFLDPDVLGVTETWRSRPITTYHRHDRLDALLNAEGPVDLARVTTSLRDHEGGILGLCRHPDPERPAHLRTHTAFAAAIDLDSGAMHYTEGPPCESEFTTVTLAEVTARLDA
ncbi:isopenicillin-N N-acyltransferase-like protein [Stackebrandtia albiflava]|uniref:Isopenicillin-N N-acyltransferase-like protein n=1 Tax=Stackebrandtia albiflava TaxID=406432 RepID=A0A562VBS4_9ACTN|nr:C45 family peptidase [Stackebrandtia albiflava]TWJ15326.1 isopenicillin-N N-acyltransferase-like protein [Stackebrandtia albiflava]